MAVQVLLFGHYRDLAPDGLALAPAQGWTALDAAAAVVRLCPAAEGLTAVCRVAKNGEYAGWNTPVTDGDELAFLPPMSGG
jgi:molybdopterin converting factor small subunit